MTFDDYIRLAAGVAMFFIAGFAEHAGRLHKPKETQATKL